MSHTNTFQSTPVLYMYPSRPLSCIHMILLNFPCVYTMHITWQTVLCVIPFIKSITDLCEYHKMFKNNMTLQSHPVWHRPHKGGVCVFIWWWVKSAASHTRAGIYERTPMRSPTMMVRRNGQLSFFSSSKTQWQTNLYPGVRINSEWNGVLARFHVLTKINTGRRARVINFTRTMAIWFFVL